jgi:Kef-type K+ transport system membrane component KefB
MLSDPILVIGIIVTVGFLFGELAHRIKLPKVTGFIIAGIVLNPRLLPLVPPDITDHTTLVTEIALSFITFSVGGSLYLGRIRSLGKTIIWVTVLEAELAMLAVAFGFVALAPILGMGAGVALIIPLGVLLGALASPTDPSATLAVSHEYHARGDVSSTILGVAALDDACGIMNYSLGVAVAQILLTHAPFNFDLSVVQPVLAILGGVFTGMVFGYVFNRISLFMRRETEGAFIVVIFAMLLLCFGTAHLFRCDELLSTMTAGVVVVNFNPTRDMIFTMLERYTEELVFVLFFTLSGMQLDFSTLVNSLFFIALFVVLRAIGKAIGAVSGAFIAQAPSNVKKYTALGLLPQGGIVIGLALMIQASPAFASISGTIVSIVIGATVVHEVVGPLLAKIALQRAGEIPPL